MLSPERLARYRRMSPADRWKETEALMALAWEALLALSPRERQRRLEAAGAVRPMRRRKRRVRGR